MPISRGSVSSMKAVLFINTSWNIYNFRIGLIRALQRKGYEVHAVAPEDAYSERLPALGCIYHPIEMNNTGSNLFSELALVFRIYGLYKKIKPQIALHYTVKPNIYGALVAKWLGIPSISNVSGLGTVFLTSGSTSIIAKVLYRWAFKSPDMIFFQNQHDRELFHQQRLLVSSNHELIPGSGVNIQRFSAVDKVSSRPPFIFLMMARLIEEKGVREYYQAARILQSLNLSVQCLLLGAPDPGHRRGIPLEDINSWHNHRVIEYLGEVPDVRPYLRKAHALVLPSYREGLSRSLLEAAAMAKPIIATDVPGCREVVKDQINGLLCQPRSPDELAGKMRILYDMQDSELAKMGRNGRELVEKQFDENLVIEKYLITIDNIIKRSE